MTEKPDTGLTTQWVRPLAQARGLDRAYALYPETIAAAVARGTGLSRSAAGRIFRGDGACHYVRSDQVRR